MSRIRGYGEGQVKLLINSAMVQPHHDLAHRTTGGPQVVDRLALILTPKPLALASKN